MKKLTMSLALALTALTLNALQADPQPQPQQRPTPHQPRPKIAQTETAPAAAQPAVQNGQKAVDATIEQKPNNNGQPQPVGPDQLPTPKADGSGFLLKKSEPMQNSSSQPAKPTETITITEVAGTTPSFSTLSNALKASGLLTTLKGNGPYTIFAPNDKAFSKLSPNALSDLLRPENKDKLVNLLSKHIVAGKVTAENLKSSKLKTLNGQTLDVKVTPEGITVNNAKVEKIAIPASNGVIYIVDTVLQP